MQPKPEEPDAEEVTNSMVDRLNKVSIFAPLSEEEIQQLANVSTTRVYAPGEYIVTIGQQGNSMFIVLKGVVTAEDVCPTQRPDLLAAELAVVVILEGLQPGERGAQDCEERAEPEQVGAIPRRVACYVAHDSMIERRVRNDGGTS